MTTFALRYRKKKRANEWTNERFSIFRCIGNDVSVRLAFSSLSYSTSLSFSPSSSSSSSSYLSHFPPCPPLLLFLWKQISPLFWKAEEKQAFGTVSRVTCVVFISMTSMRWRYVDNCVGLTSPDDSVDDAYARSMSNRPLPVGRSGRQRAVW